MTTETQTPATAPSADTSAAPAAAPVSAASDQPAAPAAAPAAPASLLTDGAQPSADQTQQGASTETPPGDKPAEDQVQGAPEAYADFTAPEGMTFNPEAMAEFTGLAKEMNLSQENAQKMADLGGKLVQKVQADQMKQIEQAQAQWASDARADKEFGGDKLGENMALANQALKAFASPELTTLLKESGLGNHPEIIRVFWKVGQAISSDSLVPGGKKPGEQGAQGFYGNSNMNP